MKNKIAKIREQNPWIYKILLIVVFVAFHFTISRGIRTALFKVQVPEQLIERIENNNVFHIQELSTRLIYIELDYNQYHREWKYKLPFGQFFLFGILGLIIIGADKVMYYLLIGAHAIIVLLSGIVFRMDVINNYYLLNVPDFLSIYLAPLSAFGVVTLAYMYKKVKSS